MAVLCALIPALAPLGKRGMAFTHDGFLHVQRLIAIEAAMHQGTPFARWLPDLAYGYGQPLLLYYPPLAYLPGLLARLLGAGYVASTEIASGLALVLSGVTMYLLARSLFGPIAATVAAIVYAVLPYQLVDLYVRGALAEGWAFVWLPLCSWCLIQAWADRRPAWSIGLALALAGLVLTHNATALLFLPALAVLALVLQLGGQLPAQRLPLRPILALASGLALSAWFWLPALAERDFVQIRETLEPRLFASFFVRDWPPFRLEPLYDYQQPVSTALGFPIFWPQIGLVQVIMTVVGAILAVRMSGVGRAAATWAMVLAAGGYVLQLQPLAPIYDLVPLLAFVQFPWRLLALVGLGSAILAGALVEGIRARTSVRGAVAVIIVGAALVTALARLDPEMVPADGRFLSTESILRGELAEHGLGTTHSGEYLTVTSGQRNTTRLRKTMLDAGGGRARESPPAPSALHVERVDWRADRIRVEVTASAPDTLILHQFAFPGWVAYIDGDPASVSAAGQLGLLGVDVPAGQHVVEVTWGWTPVRIGAALVSLAGLLLLVPLATRGRWLPRPRAWLPVLAVMGLLGGVLMLPSTATPAGGSDTPGLAPLAVGDALTLVDVRHDTSRLTADRMMLSRLTWLVRQAPTEGFRAHVEVAAADGTVHRAPWSYEPLSRLWERGELVPTTVAARLPGDFPPGPATLRLVFERPEGVAPAPLGSIDVPVPAPASWSGHVVETPDAAVAIGTDLRLTAAPSDGDAPGAPLQARVGTSLDIPLRWEQVGALPNVERELLVAAALEVPGGDVVSEARRPGDWFSPLPFWQPGEVVDQNIRLTLPESLSPGAYPAVIRVYSRDLARGGASEPGASSARPRGRPIAELQLGKVTILP